MITAHELKGWWNKPTQDKSYSGTLMFDGNSDPRLEVLEGPNLNFSDRNIKVIQGRTTDGFATLLDTYRRSGSYSNNTKVGVSIYQPSFIFLGYLFDSIDDIKFTSVHFTAFNLHEWLNVNGVNYEHSSTSHSIEYRKSKNIYFEMSAQCQAKIEFLLNTEYLNGNTNIRLDQSCKVIFTYQVEKPFMDILTEIFELINFLTLCTYEQSYPMSITFFNERFRKQGEMHNDKNFALQPVRCFYRNSHYNPSYKTRRGFECLINYETISSSFNSVVKNWIKESNVIRPVIDLLLRSFRDKYHFSSEKFMDAVRAIETFHRTKHNNHVISKDEIKRIGQVIEKSDLSPAQKKLIKEKLNFAYEPTLKHRLEEMIGLYQISYFQTRVSDSSEWVKKVKDSRNYYTHFDQKGKHKAAESNELFRLTEDIKLLLFSAILKSLGIPEDAFKNSICSLIY